MVKTLISLLPTPSALTLVRCNLNRSSSPIKPRCLRGHSLLTAPTSPARGSSSSSSPPPPPPSSSSPSSSSSPCTSTSLSSGDPPPSPSTPPPPPPASAASPTAISARPPADSTPPAPSAAAPPPPSSAASSPTASPSPSSGSTPSPPPPPPPTTASSRTSSGFLAALPPSPFVVSLLGYCIEGRRRLIVYEYMCNGSLQEALFGSRAVDLDWDRRSGIVLDVARALAFLHLECDPPVIHGDIKPSNVLLGSDYHAMISDFGLSRIKSEADSAIELFSQELGPSQELVSSGSPQVDFAVALRATASNACKNPDRRTTNTNGNARSGGELKFQGSGSPKGKEVATVTPCEDELCTDDDNKDLNANSQFDDSRMDINGQWGKDWWWKQDESGELCSKDYVREWIGTQICPSRNPDWDDARKSSPENCFEFTSSNRVEKPGGEETLFEKLGPSPIEKRKPEKKPVKGLGACDKNNREMREWWKEEYFAEISKKGGKCSKGLSWFRTHSSISNNNVSGRGLDLNVDISFRKGWKKKRSRSVGSDMWSGDLFSRELSSTTTSMRGTVCYVAPEFGGCGHLMEKADIYSFGVLLLVIVSGRRPLHVLSSPMKLEKANLISWCRQLVQMGNALDLVDERLKDSYSKEQASLCINLALLCLQRTPELRPDSGDIVKILEGEMDLPVVPFEFSPSPPSKLRSKSRRKATMDAE